VKSKGALAAPFLILAAFVATVGFARAEEPAHLSIALQSCAGSAPHGSGLASFSFKRVDASGALHGDLTLTPNAAGTIAFDVDLPAGFYAYSVVSPPCSYDSYVGVLPGKHRTVLGDMANGEAGLKPALLMMGTLPSGYSGSLVRYARSVECGNRTSGVPVLGVDGFETEDDAYYLYDTQKYGSSDSQFGLKVSSPSGQRVTFVLTATYPPPTLNGAPAYARYDITSDLFQRALAHTPAGNAVCIGTPSG